MDLVDDLVLRSLRAMLLYPELRQGVLERLADASAELWPDAPPLPLSGCLTDEQLLLVVNRALGLDR